MNAFREKDFTYDEAGPFYIERGKDEFLYITDISMMLVYVPESDRGTWTPCPMIEALQAMLTINCKLQEALRDIMHNALTAHPDWTAEGDRA